MFVWKLNINKCKLNVEPIIEVIIQFKSSNYVILIIFNKLAQFCIWKRFSLFNCPHHKSVFFYFRIKRNGYLPSALKKFNLKNSVTLNVHRTRRVCLLWCFCNFVFTSKKHNAHSLTHSPSEIDAQRHRKQNEYNLRIGFPNQIECDRWKSVLGTWEQAQNFSSQNRIEWCRLPSKIIWNIV